MEENIKLIEHYMEYYSKDYVFRKAIENLIKGYKELKEKVNKVEDNYIEKSKVSKYLNKMEKDVINLNLVL